jgi:S1-C subfamily serine protease
MLHSYRLVAPPADEIMETFAGKVISRSEAEDGFAGLLAILRECPESATAFAQLLRLAHLAGRQAHRVERVRTYRAALVAIVTGIVVVAVLFAAFFLGESRTEEAAIRHVYERMSPAVASIQVQSAGVAGSGVVFDRHGYLLTSFHVIEKAQHDKDISVQLPDLGQVPAELVGYDRATDLAVLRVDALPDRLTVASFGDTNEVRIGDVAIAIGSPFGLSRSLTVGHISAVQRRLESYDPRASYVEGVLQTDAAINPGNSGGPLFNASGQVIGINMRIESPSGGSVGIGFAIPSNTVNQVVRQIIEQSDARRSLIAGK